MQYNLNERIKSGLIFLLLGQNCFYKENPLLQVISSEYQLGSVGISHDLYLEIENIDSISWIKNQADLILVPDSLKIISRLPWNGIMTSEVDGIIERVFRNNWREVSAIRMIRQLINAVGHGFTLKYPKKIQRMKENGRSAE